MTNELDLLKINFDESGLWMLNITLAIIMFGVALGITTEDFKLLFNNPKILLTGVFSQFILFPILTFFLVKAVNPAPSVALGMILVAACPGGNISNFMTQMAGGNAALSVSLTAFATLVSLIMTPLNFQFWSSLHEPTAMILRSVELDPFKLVKLVILILGIPLIVGMSFRKWKPQVALKLMKYLKPFSVIIFLLLIVIAFSQNLDIFIKYIHYVFFIVLLHNIIGLVSGFYFAKFMRLNFKNQKTLSIETGIQNSGLGLLLVFAFFDGLGGMALLVAFWGIWDIVSGLLLASYWSYKENTKTIEA
ncbi:bile acid:sodium symporter family protein [Urechidicola croceus]|uniref:Symporter n=1 Tax=Urechidicola croceus TaxID=1850246 RepID=A0A1D8PBI5_9FLAO|nr:bile acid:sodium symporter family protein [Urechidicola croceus]AOW21925.1 symporter [Urechidicola croceus]